MAEPTVRERLKHLLEQTELPSYHKSAEVRAQVFQTAGEILEYLGAEEKALVINSLSASLKWKDERTIAVLGLQDLIDLRRAMNWKPRKPQRSPADRIYPTSGWLGSYLLWAQENEVPLAFHFWSAVTAFGAGCQRNIYLDRQSHLVWPNYYTLLVGPPASKKGTAIGMAMDIISRLNGMLAAEDWPLDRRVTILPETVTPVMMLNILQTKPIPDESKPGSVRAKNAVALLANEEITTLIGKANFQSNRLVQIFTALYNCPKRWEDSAFLRGDFVLTNIAISVLGGSAPEWIRDEITPAMLRGGFLSRCHFVYRERSERIFPEAGSTDPVVANALAEQLLPLTKSPLMSLTLDEPATYWFNGWYKAFRAEPPEDEVMASFKARKDLHVLKLGGVLALSNNPDSRVITKDELMMALEILTHEETLLPEMFSQFLSSEESRKEDRVYSIINAAPEGGITRSKLGNLTYRLVQGKSGLDRIIANMVDRRWIDSELRGGSLYYFNIRKRE